eukprot:300502_1
MASAFCELLSDDSKQKKYFKEYQLLIVKWINFEFYNFQCEYCQHINKTIMINRVYQYSKSLNLCRACNKIQPSRARGEQNQFNIQDVLKHKSLNNVSEIYQIGSGFSLYSLYAYLKEYGVHKNHSAKVQQYIRQQEYDSDALLQDISDTSIQSNISTFILKVLKDANCDKLLKKFSNYDRYPVYKSGTLTRYLALNPKYSSLLAELCLNSVCPLPTENWETVIFVEILKEFNKQNTHSNSTDFKFGIEEHEPIGINHLITIFIFTDAAFTDYRHCLVKSYSSIDPTMHRNNFYWIGRWLHESIDFFGTPFANYSAKQLYCGFSSIQSFNSFAPLFSSPMLATENQVLAEQWATRKGCTCILAAKYSAHIDNSKLLDIFAFNKEIRLLNPAKLQIVSIRTMKPVVDLGDTVLAIRYIENIFLQTQFDARCYSADDLHNETNIKAAYLLILNQVGNLTTVSHFEVAEYAAHLFDSWCFAQEFVTFETLGLEIHYMNYHLKDFLFDETTNKINIINVKSFLPNLKYYYDINGVFRMIKEKLLNEIDISGKTQVMSSSLYNSQSDAIPYHITEALHDIHFNFDECEGTRVMREAFRIKLSKLDIKIESFHKNREYFRKQLISTGISASVASSCISNLRNNAISYIKTATKTTKLIELILDELETQYGNNVNCDVFTKKQAFQNLYSKDLKKFEKPVKKREKVTFMDLYKVAKAVAVFDAKTADKLAQYLQVKIMRDKEKIVPWECQTCQFLNTPLVVNGLWRYYNEGNKCGMCGDSRYLITNNANAVDD